VTVAPDDGTTLSDDTSIDHLADGLKDYAEAARELARRLPTRKTAHILVVVAVAALIAAVGSGVGVWLIRDTQLSSVKTSHSQQTEAGTVKAQAGTLNAQAATIAAQARQIAAQSAQLARQERFDEILGGFLIEVLSQPGEHLTPAEQATKAQIQRFLAATPTPAATRPAPPSTTVPHRVATPPAPASPPLR
jgi:hypothetical protein